MIAANDLDTPTGQREAKALATLQAQFALHGWELVRGDPEVRGQAPYFVVRHRHMQALADLDEARAVLEKLSEAEYFQTFQGQ